MCEESCDEEDAEPSKSDQRHNFARTCFSIHDLSPRQQASPRTAIPRLHTAYCILHTSVARVSETITVLCCHGGCHIYPIITFGPASLNTSGELVCRPSPGSLGATRAEFKHRPHVDCKSLQECGAAWRSSCCRSRSLPCHVTPTWPTSGPQGQGQDNGPQPVTSAVTPEGERCRDFGERVVMTGAVC